MSYTKYTWQTGEVITAAKLNNMEDGIDDKLIVNMLDDETGELDVSYADLLAAWTAKKQVILYYHATAVGGDVYESVPLINIFIDPDNKYKASFININVVNRSAVGIIFEAETDSAHLAYEPD